MQSHWLIWAILSAAFAAGTAVMSKLGLRDVHPDLAQLVRTAVVMAAVVALNAANGGWARMSELTRSSWIYLSLAGIATAASWICYFRALSIGDASRVATVDKLSVPLVACAGVLLLGERLSLLGWLGVLTAFSGVTLLALSK
jgi:transporter family protein